MNAEQSQTTSPPTTHMLQKAKQVEVDPAEPFKNDCLQRAQCAENLSALIKTYTEPFVLSISGSWGSGKTTFVKMWKTQLENDGHKCIYFNAWENDFADDPLVACVAALQSHLGEDQLLSDSPKLAKALGVLKSSGKILLRHGAPVAIRLATQGLLDGHQLDKALGVDGAADAVAEAAQAMADDRFDDFTKSKNALAKFRESLQKLVAGVAESKESKEPKESEKSKKSKLPLVFFIDELDRCRPTFAVEFLERIKHALSVPGIVFVLSVDREQLSKSVCALYGQGTDTEGYLRRFFDLDFRLPPPNCEQYWANLRKQFRLDEALVSRGVSRRDLDDLFHSLPLFSSAFGRSLREMEQLATETRVAIMLTPKGYKLAPAFLAFLLVLRAARPQLFRDYVSGATGASGVLEHLAELPGMAAFIEHHRSLQFEAWLRRCSKIPGEFKQGDMFTQEPQGERAALLIRTWQSPEFEIDDPRTFLDYLLSKLEFTQRLKV